MKLMYFLLLMFAIPFVSYANEVYYDVDGNQVDAQGNIIVAASENSEVESDQVFYDAQGNEVDKEGNVITSYEDQTSDEKVIDKEKFSLNYDIDGNPVTPQGDIIEDVALAEQEFLGENQDSSYEETNTPTYGDEPNKNSNNIIYSIIAIVLFFMVIIGGYIVFKK